MIGTRRTLHDFFFRGILVDFRGGSRGHAHTQRRLLDELKVGAGDTSIHDPHETRSKCGHRVRRDRVCVLQSIWVVAAAIVASLFASACVLHEPTQNSVMVSHDGASHLHVCCVLST